jgi:hypothetical protein
MAGWEAYSWLRYGIWPLITPYSISVAVLDGTDFVQWLQKPNSWIGLHRIIKFLMELQVWFLLIALPAGALVLAEILDGPTRIGGTEAD